VNGGGEHGGVVPQTEANSRARKKMRKRRASSKRNVLFFS